MPRFVIDAPTLVHLVTEGIAVAPAHQLVAPQLLRSQALDLLYGAVRRGELTEREALDRSEAMTGVKVRLLGDRVSRRVAWQLAREHGFDSTAEAEYLAVTRLQADLFVSVDRAARARAEGIVPVGTVEQLSVERAQSAGSSTQSGPLTSPGPARSAASTIV
jgi:predicted nucleic acid-binding protein